MNKAPIPIPVPVKVTAINLAMLTAARSEAAMAPAISKDILRKYFPEPTEGRKKFLPEL